MRTHAILGATFLAAIIATPALARDRTGYQAIAAGNLAAAEEALEAERAIYPTRPELMLNLAAVYARTDRARQARSLYSAVLDGEPVMLDMPSGATVSSHDVARRGLAQLGALTAAR